MHEGQAKCGAKTRKGVPCKDISMKNGRCKRHGGKSTGPKNPNTKAAAKAVTKLGIYSRFLTDADRSIYDEAADALGTVDGELQLMRLRLARTVKGRTDWEASLTRGEGGQVVGEGEGSFVLVERVEDQSIAEGCPVDVEKKTFRLPDFDKIEQATLARIESLEKTRRELLKASEGEDPDADPDDPGRDRVAFSGGLDGGDDEELPSPFEAP